MIERVESGPWKETVLNGVDRVNRTSQAKRSSKGSREVLSNLVCAVFGKEEDLFDSSRSERFESPTQEGDV